MRRIAPFLVLFCIAAAQLCAASGASYTGNFAADADVREIFFTLSAPGSVTLRTLSYAGGVNSAGTTIPAGGFDPTISVFDSGGRLVAYNRDGGCGNVAADAVTSFCWDSFLQVSLPAGNYTAVLTQSENLPNGPTLADSFVYNPALCVPALVCPTDANGNFTTAPGSAPPGFWDFSLRQRSSFYALDILGATASAVPAITSSAVLPSAIVSQPYQTTFTAAYGSGLALTWSVAAGSLPGGLALNAATGVLSGVPTSTGSFPFTIQVTDGVQAVMQSVLLTVSSPSIPVIPVIPSPVVITGNLSLGDVAVGSPVAASYNAAGGAPPYTFLLSGAPGLTVDSNGNVRGLASQAGNFNPRLTATDSANNSSLITLSLAVLGLTGSFPAGTTTSGYSGSASGVGGVPPYSYSASGVPKGLTFSGGTLTGQPAYPGTFTIGVQVTDSNGITVAGNFSFTITGPAPAVLTITSISLPDGFVGQPYSETLAAIGGSPGYTWVQTGQQIPPGLSINRAGTVAGIPTDPGLFTYNLGVQVTDTSGAQAIGTVSINIQPAPLQMTSGAVFPTGQVGVNYPPQILTSTGGTPPYTFSITGGSLPAGLTLSNGLIGGTPSVAGPFAFTLIATDSAATPLNASVGITGLINPTAPDLSLSAATASFSLAPGSSAPPTPATVSVSSTDVSQILSFTTSSSVPWLTVAGSTSTPGSITVGPNAAALSLTPDQSPYFGTVTATCTSQACAGITKTIAVSLTVTPPPPQLSLGSELLSFVALASNPQPSSTALAIVNVGGGSLAIQSVSAADSFISVGAFPATVAPGPGGAVTITANPMGLKPGYYFSSLTVVSSAGTASVPVTLLISASAFLTLGPSGTLLSLPQGGALGNPNGSFLVGVSNGSVSFNAAVLPGAPWLSGGGSGVASPASPATVKFSIDQTAAAALSAGAYYGTIRVTSSGVTGSLQDYQVVLSVGPPNSQIVPNPQPSGLIFIGSGAALPPQAIQLFASSKNPIAFQASATTTDGAGWLSIAPATGLTSAASPASVKVTANPAGLAPGVYRGSVSFAFTTAVRSVNVTLIVEGVSTGTSGSGASLAPRDTITACTGGQLVPTQTGLVSNFLSPASWPTPLAVNLVDTCGNPIANAQVSVTFSNGDPPLALSAVDPTNGLYEGTWTPRRASSQVTILARASAPGFPSSATVQIAGQVAPNTVPVLAPNGTLDVFHPQVGAGLGPGNIVQIYGTGLAAQISAPTTLPLPTQVNGTIVIIGGKQAPLYYVSPGQINAQVPFELTAGDRYQVIVSANGQLTTPQPIQLTDAVPSILQFNSGVVVAEHQDGTLVSDSSPAVPGEYLVIYLTGLGDTDIPVPSGTASPSNPPANVLNTPILTLNGNQIPVLFAGLTPTLVGLYQINFQVPQTLVTGEYPLLISQNGTVSNQTILSVHQ